MPTPTPTPEAVLSVPVGAVVAWLLVIASSDLTIKLWDVVTGQELQVLIGRTGEVNSVAFSPDGAILASTAWVHPTLLRQASS
jgi:WD40 repeat protein